MNNTNDKLDHLIALAMFDYGAEETAEFEAIDDTDIVIPKSFDRKIYRLIARKKRESKIKKIKKISFRVAVAAMLIMSIMFVSIMSISSLREAIWNVIVKWYDDYVAIIFTQGEPKATDELPGIMATDKEGVLTNDEEKVEGEPEASPPTEILEYKKPVVADVYREVELEKIVSYYMLEYYVEDEWRFIYWQTVYEEDEQKFDNTQAGSKNVSIGTYTGVILLKEEGQNSITWTDGEYLYTITGCLTESQLIEIAKTVE